MIFKQKHTFLLPSFLTIEFKETGFSYKFEDRGFFGSKRLTDIFIHYADIGNQKEYNVQINPFTKSLYISISIISFVIYIFVIFNIFSEKIIEANNYEAPLVWGPVTILFLIYKIWAKQKVIILRGNNTFVTLFNDEIGENITKEIYTRRNKYYRNKIFTEMKGQISFDSIEYFDTLGVLSKEEIKELKEKNDPNKKTKMGLNIEQQNA